MQRITSSSDVTRQFNLSSYSYSSQETVQREASELVTFIDKHNGKPLELTFELNVAVLNVIWQLVASKIIKCYIDFRTFNSNE